MYRFFRVVELIHIGSEVLSSSCFCVSSGNCLLRYFVRNSVFFLCVHFVWREELKFIRQAPSFQIELKAEWNSVWWANNGYKWSQFWISWKWNDIWIFYWLIESSSGTEEESKKRSARFSIDSLAVFMCMLNYALFHWRSLLCWLTNWTRNSPNYRWLRFVHVRLYVCIVKPLHKMARIVKHEINMNRLLE